MPLRGPRLRIFDGDSPEWRFRKPGVRQDLPGLPQPSHHRMSRRLKSAGRSLRSFLRLFVILVIDHHTLQSINRAIKLSIFLFAYKLLFVRGKRGIAPSQNQSTLLVRSEGGLNIWGYAFFVNDLFSRGIVFGSREAQSRSVGQLYNALHRTLSERCFAHEYRPVQILQRARHNLCTTRTPAVDKEHNGEILMLLRILIREILAPL